jgi:hypothetical protein
LHFQLEACGLDFLPDLNDNIPQGTQFNGKLEFEEDVSNIFILSRNDRDGNMVVISGRIS